MRIYSFLLLFIYTYSASSFAVSLTSYRIYLDKNHRSEAFMVFNRGQQSENCKLSWQDFPFDNAGNMGKRITGKTPKTSVINWVRFSPRAFSIKSGHSQTVRFSLRRKANMKPSEYQSYISIDCGKIIDKSQKSETLSLTPRLVHDVPVIARTGELAAKVSISNAHVNNNGKLVFRLNRSGNRSVYGKIEIVNADTNKVVNYLQGVSIYTQSSYRNFEFSLPKNTKPSSLLISFIEDKKYGGNLVVQHQVSL
ncbi:MAG: hypothetical protein JKX78_12830 [Alteromonadaceae bacterium]|nr:hypothetical protein [Alteromonadaceae bacterium]